MKENVNLKEILTGFKISNLELAKATGIDPSLVSRYLSGNRKLKGTGKHVELIAEYLIIKADTVEKINWLRNRLDAAGLPVKATSVMNIKYNLVKWISSDGEAVPEPGQAADGPDGIQEDEERQERQKGLRTGVLSITSFLSGLFNALQKEESVDVFLTSDRIRILTNETFSSMVKEALSSKTKNCTMNIVIGLSGNTQGMNKIIQCYMGELVSGKIRFYTFFGTTQNVSEQLYLIFRQNCVMMVTESPIGLAEPVGTIIRDPEFVEELCQSFDATYRYSQPMFNIHNDSNTRGMIEVIYGEYCLPGDLCVVKDSINPMYMSYESYCRFLKVEKERKQESDAEYAWKCNEYRRFNDGFKKMLETGMGVREIISLSRLRSIIAERKCKMAGLYFLSTGYSYLDLQGCRDILTGYIDHLNKYECFSLLILDDLPELHRSNCWHVKRSTSIAINDWNEEPIMCESRHSTLVNEFQRHFERIWERGSGSLMNRAYIISILQGIIGEMDEVIRTM